MYQLAEQVIEKAYGDIENGLKEIYSASNFVSEEVNKLTGGAAIKAKINEYYDKLSNAVYWKLKDLIDEFYDSPNIRHKNLTGMPEDKPYALAIWQEIWNEIRADSIKESQHVLIQEVKDREGENSVIAFLLVCHAADILVSLDKIMEAKKAIEHGLNRVKNENHVKTNKESGNS